MLVAVERRFEAELISRKNELEIEVHHKAEELIVKSDQKRV